MKILVMGLPGSGKTTLASKLVPLLNAKWLNGDKIRKQANDWDFSLEGRKKQAKRMADLANKYKSEGHVVISDFICPTEKARKLAFSPHINIGVFSLEKNSTIWNVWQKNLSQTLKSGKIFGSEGLAINMSVYIDEVETEFLPLNCNWIASNLLPKFDEINQKFVEPFLPNYKIGIMHLAAGIWKDNQDMRMNKDIKVELYTLEGKKILKSLRYIS